MHEFLLLYVIISYECIYPAITEGKYSDVSIAFNLIKKLTFSCFGLQIGKTKSLLIFELPNQKSILTAYII